VDSVIETVLREYELRSDAELKQMRELPPAEAMKRIDEFLLAVGPATGQLTHATPFFLNHASIRSHPSLASFGR